MSVTLEDIEKIGNILGDRVSQAASEAVDKKVNGTVKRLDNQVVELVSTISGLSGEVGGMRSELNDLRDDVNRLEVRIEQFEQRDRDLASTVREIEPLTGLAKVTGLVMYLAANRTRIIVSAGVVVTAAAFVLGRATGAS